MSYESPITAIYEQISNQINQDFEDRIMAEVKMKVDVNVDKEELIKALNYDRGQYEKGKEDAIRVLKPMCRYLGMLFNQHLPKKSSKRLLFLKSLPFRNWLTVWLKKALKLLKS